MIRSSGLALHQACQTTANQIKKNDFMAECGRLGRTRLLLHGRRFVCCSVPRDIPPTYPYPLDEKLNPSCPWLFTPETTCSPMVLSALFAQEDRYLTSDYSPWLSLALLCYGIQGPYSGRHFFFLFFPVPDPPPAVVRRPCHGFGPRDRAGQGSRAANHGLVRAGWHA